MNGIGKTGDIYLTPQNMAPAGSQRNAAQAQRAFLPAMEDALGRVLRREASDIRAAAQKLLAKRGAEAFVDWMGDFYEEHRGFTVNALTPAAQGYAEMIVEDMQPESVQTRIGESLNLFAIRHAGQAQLQIKEALSEPDPGKAIEGILSGWDAGYVERQARLELSKQTVLLKGLDETMAPDIERIFTTKELRTQRSSESENQKPSGGTIIIDTTGKSIEQNTNQVLEGIRSLGEMVLKLEQRETPAPTVVVNVPEQPAPVVTVNVPQQPAPEVNVTNEVNIPEPPARQILIKKQGDTWIGEAE
jgi:hypothetical protein